MLQSNPQLHIRKRLNVCLRINQLEKLLFIVSTHNSCTSSFSPKNPGHVSNHTLNYTWPRGRGVAPVQDCRLWPSAVCRGGAAVHAGRRLGQPAACAVDGAGEREGVGPHNRSVCSLSTWSFVFVVFFGLRNGFSVCGIVCSCLCNTSYPSTHLYNLLLRHFVRLCSNWCSWTYVESYTSTTLQRCRSHEAQMIVCLSHTWISKPTEKKYLK